MPKTSHSSTRVAHRGPRHDSDPDRRVKYVLRRKRKGDEVTLERTVVRRHRRSPDRELAPAQVSLRQRLARRRRRREVREQLDELAHSYNAYGQVMVAEPLTH